MGRRRTIPRTRRHRALPGRPRQTCAAAGLQLVEHTDGRVRKELRHAAVHRKPERPVACGHDVGPLRRQRSLRRSGRIRQRQYSHHGDRFTGMALSVRSEILDVREAASVPPSQRGRTPEPEPQAIWIYGISRPRRRRSVSGHVGGSSARQEPKAVLESSGGRRSSRMEAQSTADPKTRPGRAGKRACLPEARCETGEELSRETGDHLSG